MRHYLKTLFLLALLFPAWAAAQDAAQKQSATVNVTWTKAQYENLGKVVKWSDDNGVSHEDYLTTVASNPKHIIALLKEVYTNRAVPGIYYAGYGTVTGQNTNTRRRQVYYGGINGGWQIPFTNSKGTYTDYDTYKPNVEGYTLLLVAVRPNFNKTYNAAGNQIIDPVYLTYTGANTNVDTYEKLVNYIGNAIEFVQLIPGGMRLNEQSNDTDYPAGTLFTVSEAKGLNRFFFISKGQARDQLHHTGGDNTFLAPFGRMFEQFSPTTGNPGDEETNFYETIRNGKAFDVKHDCNSVIDVEHYFSMAGKSNLQTQDVDGLQLFIPDRRLTYFSGKQHWGFTTYPYENASSTNDSGYNNDGRDMNGTRKDNGSWWGDYAQFAYYNSEYMPKTTWYRIELEAEAQQKDNPNKWGEHTYEVTLAWTSTTNDLSKEVVDEDFWVYELDENGDLVALTINTNDAKGKNHLLSSSLTKNSDGKYEITVTTTDDLYQRQLITGRKITYVVTGRPVIADYPAVRSNPADVIIPGYDQSERLVLTIGSDYYSKYYYVDENNQYNQYCNTVVISNGTGTSVTDKLLGEGTKFEVQRSYTDDDGVQHSGIVAEVTFSNKKTNSIDWKVNYMDATNLTFPQEGTVEGVMAQSKPATSGTFQFVTNAKGEKEVVFEYTTGTGSNKVTHPFEIWDVFRASTIDNKHPEEYRYIVEFIAAEEFDYDEYTLDPNGTYKKQDYPDGTYDYVLIKDGEEVGADNCYTKKSSKTKNVHSNTERIPVYKTDFNLYSDAYTKEQVDADDDNNIDNMLAAHITFDNKRNVTTDMNKVNVNLKEDNTGKLRRYELWRNYDTNNKAMVAQVNMANGVKIGELENGNGQEYSERTASAGYNDVEDRTVMNLLGNSFSYVTVIHTAPNNTKRSEAGETNTYGTDIKRIGLPKLDVSIVESDGQDDGLPSPGKSNFKWTDPNDNQEYGYYNVILDAKGTLPNLDRYAPYAYRSWRKLQDQSVLGEMMTQIKDGSDWVNFVRNTPNGFMYEYSHNLQNANYQFGVQKVTSEFKTVFNKQEETSYTLGTFGALYDSNFTVDYIVRMYYLVKNVSEKAPRRVKAEDMTADGQFYVVDYKLPVDFIQGGVFTSIEKVTDAEVQSVMYYNAVGMASTQPWSGVNIAVTRYTDGTTRTVKVVR